VNLCKRAVTGQERRSAVFPALTLVLIGLVLLPAVSASGQPSVTLAWNPVTNAGITGYSVYYGTASRSYSARMDAGSATQAKVSGLAAGVKYFFTVTSYTSRGVESDYSAETTFTPTNPPPGITFTTGGSAFAPATIDFSATVVSNGHTINKVVFYNANNVLGEVLSPPYTFSWRNVPIGTYTLGANAFYDGVAVQGAPTTQVTVYPAPAFPFNVSLLPGSAAISAPFALSGGMISQSIQTTTISLAGRATFTFTNRQAGNYIVSAQVVAPTATANSFYVNIDADPTDPLMIWNLPVNPALTNQTVTWAGISDFVPKVFYLSAGVHQLVVCGREQGVQLGAITISPAPFTMRALPNRQIVLSGVAQPSYRYQILASQDLKKWTLIGTVTSDATGSFSFTDTAAPSFPLRYYQLKS
jgi:hypothetical protein